MAMVMTEYPEVNGPNVHDHIFCVECFAASVVHTRDRVERTESKWPFGIV